MERAAGEVAQQKIKTLRAHGFNQRPRFDRVATLSQPDRKATSFITSHFTWTILYSPARTPTLGPCSTRLCRERWLARRELAGWPWALRAAQPTASRAARAGCGEHALPAPAGQRGRGRAGRPVRQQHERRHSASALHAALRQALQAAPQAAAPPCSPASAYRRSPTRRWGLNPWPCPSPRACGRAPGPGNDAGACLRPALTSWRKTLRLRKKNKTLLGESLFCTVLCATKCYSCSPYIDVRTTRIAFLHGFCATKCYYSSLYIYVRTGVIACFARFCAEKSYYSRPYIHVHPGVIAFARFCATKCYYSYKMLLLQGLRKCRPWSNGFCTVLR